ncbi:MAG: gamma-glutamyl-gamma-aminobutyrate hydrolase family protein [Crocinitomicaceae bacterium]|nr:gamma-glutamyl-gamma-aminobutyrate hydrolase family protein [Crocinitomicaceae bacterium]
MILVINCGSDKAPFIHEIVDEFMDVKTIPFHDLDEAELNEYNGIIFSGAPLLVTEIDMTPYLEKVQWLKTTNKPVLGICFGHQLLGITYGAFAARMKEDRDWQTIEVFEESPLFDKLPTEIRMMQDHCETISIPSGFKLVGSSDACVNEIMQHHEKPLFGIQFHPEVSGNHGRVLIENFIKLCL